MSHKLTSKIPIFVPLRPHLALLLSLALFILVFAASARSSVDEAAVFGKCWDYKTLPNLSVRMAADASNVYFVDAENRIHGVDLLLGKKIWSSELGGDVVSNLLAVGDSVVVVTSTQS